MINRDRDSNNIKICVIYIYEKVTETKLISPLLGKFPNLSPRGEVRKAEDDGNPSRPKRFRAARKSMEEEEGFRPYKPPPPSPGRNPFR